MGKIIGAVAVTIAAATVGSMVVESGESRGLDYSWGPMWDGPAESAPEDPDSNVWLDTEPQGEGNYTVQPEDSSTWQISVKCGADKAAQMAIFQVIADDTIQTGDRLNMPTDGNKCV